MKNFKSFELNNTQKLNTFGQGRPASVTLPTEAVEPVVDTTVPDFGEDASDEGAGNIENGGTPSFTGKGNGRG